MILICLPDAARLVLMVWNLSQLFDADICFCFLIKAKHDGKGDS